MSSDGKELFGRKYQITIDTLDVSALRCSFKTKKNLLPHPNSCELKIWNLSEKSRTSLSSKKVLKCRVEAGYESTGTTQLFLGEVRSATHEVDGPDVVTTVETGDSDKAIATTRIQLSVGPTVPVTQVLEAIVSKLGIGKGNLLQIAPVLATKGKATLFGVGSAISGSAARAMTDLCRSAGLEWSVQDGNLQILDLNKSLAGKAVLLSPSTGLIGSPTVDGKGVLKAKALIIPELVPGRLVVIDSKSVKGGYRVQVVEHTGDSHGSEWYVEIEGKKY